MSDDGGRWPKGITPVELADDRDPWEQQEGQTTRQHTALLAFLRLKPPRRVQDLIEGSTENPPATRYSRSYLHKLRQAHRWEEVAAAWDRHQHTLFLADLEREKRTAAMQRLRLSKAIIRTAADVLANHLNPAEVSAGAVAQLAGVADRIQRGVFEPEASKVEITGAHGGPLELADLAALPREEMAKRLADVAAERARQADLLARYYGDGTEDADDA